MLAAQAGKQGFLSDAVVEFLFQPGVICIHRLTLHILAFGTSSTNPTVDRNHIAVSEVEITHARHVVQLVERRARCAAHPPGEEYRAIFTYQ